MRWGCRLWLAVGGVALLGSCALLGKVAFTYYDFGAASRELPAAIQAYEASGLPFVASGIAPRVRDDQNAAPAIQAALAAMPGGKAEKDVSAALKSPGPGADAVLVPYGRSLRLLKGAIARPKIDFGRNWDLGPFLLFPEYAKLKTLAKVAALEAVRAAQKGDDATAIRSLTLSRQLALWAGQEPTLISMLVRIANESIALNATERCLVTVAARPERIARYARWLAAKPPLPDFGLALRGEAYMGVVTARNFDQFGGMDALTATSSTGATPKIDPTRLRHDGIPDGNQARGFLTRHLQLWTEAARATDGFRQPPQKVARTLESLSARAEGEKGLSYVLERIMLPVFAQAAEAITTLEARRAVERGFAEALTTRALTGRPPARVSVLDPFDGKPLRVRASGKSVRVWSVGRDLKDDGGLLRSELSKRGKKGEDLVACDPPPVP